MWIWRDWAERAPRRVKWWIFNRAIQSVLPISCSCHVVKILPLWYFPGIEKWKDLKKTGNVMFKTLYIVKRLLLSCSSIYLDSFISLFIFKAPLFLYQHENWNDQHQTTRPKPVETAKIILRTMASATYTQACHIWHGYSIGPVKHLKLKPNLLKAV